MTTQTKIASGLADDELIKTLKELRKNAEDGMMQRDIDSAISIIKNHDLLGYHVFGDNHPTYGKVQIISLNYNYKHPTNFAANENDIRKRLVIQSTE